MSDIEWDDLQGNILNGYRHPNAAFLLIAAPTSQAARDCLAALLPDLTTAEPWTRDAHPSTTLNIAITYRGFERFGLDERLLAKFPEAFRQPPSDRATQLGDVGRSAPAEWEPGIGTGRVHLMCTVYGSCQEVLDTERERLRKVIGETGACLVAEHETALLDHKREHFGYTDGLAQPAIEGVERRHPTGQGNGGGVPLAAGGWRPIKLGEFVLGYPDEDGEIVSEPCAELMRNGSYVVYRKLQQDVARFRAGLTQAASASGLSEELVAAKVVGRWRDGVPLVLDPDRQPDGDLSEQEHRSPDNDFRYLPDDRYGFRCPLGAHVRRANPRDALDFGGKVRDSGALTARHRMIRRGMPYGPPFDPADEDDTGERGLIFVCYNADIERQFETVQAQWCNDGNPFGLGDDRDYVLGADGGSGKMTIPIEGSTPRFVPVLRDVVVTRGAEYLFAPGRAALQRLANGAC